MQFHVLICSVHNSKEMASVEMPINRGVQNGTHIHNGMLSTVMKNKIMKISGQSV